LTWRTYRAKFAAVAAFFYLDAVLLAGVSMAWYGLEIIHHGAGWLLSGLLLVGLSLVKGSRS